MCHRSVINEHTSQVTMIVLHMIETSGPGGAENILIKLAHNINSERFHSVVCLRKPGWLYQELLNRGIETYIIPETGHFDILFLWRLVALIKRRKIALIHAHEFLMNVYGTLAGVLTGCSVITTVHGKYYYWEKWPRRVAMRFASRFSQMISVSQELKAFLQKSTGISPERVKTIYNGIEAHNGAISIHNRHYRSELSIDEDIRVIGTIANLYPVKGHTYLIQAIPRVVRVFPKVIFLFAGRGDQEQNLRQEAESLGISEHVRFLGFRPDARDLLDIMDIFVLPSLSECLPLSVLEAMAAGVPPIVTNVGGNSEIIDDSYSGFIVPPANADALAEKIIALFSQRDLARSMGLRAKKTISERFSMNRMVDEYQNLYSALIQP